MNILQSICNQMGRLQRLTVKNHSSGGQRSPRLQMLKVISRVKLSAPEKDMVKDINQDTAPTMEASKRKGDRRIRMKKQDTLPVCANIGFVRLHIQALLETRVVFIQQWWVLTAGLLVPTCANKPWVATTSRSWAQLRHNPHSSKASSAGSASVICMQAAGEDCTRNISGRHRTGGPGTGKMSCMLKWKKLSNASTISPESCRLRRLWHCDGEMHRCSSWVVYACLMEVLVST